MARSAAFAALALLVAFAPGAGASAVAVYHTSYVHGWYSARPALWDKENSTRPIGGFAALSALLKKETTPYLLLDSGDMFVGSPEGVLTRGRASAELMNLLGYDAAVPGNHDYDYGEPVLRAMISSASYTMLGANLYYKEGGHADYLKPYVLLERGGRRIAVLGLLGRHTATSTLPAHVSRLDFRDEAEEAAARLPELKALKPDAVIALVHWGISDKLSLKQVDVSTWTFNPAPRGTLRIARAAPGIDLLLGGDNHTVLLRGYHDPVSGTWLGESGYGLSYVTRAELVFDDSTGVLSKVDLSVIPLWTDLTGEDPAVKAAVAGVNAEADRELGRKLGEAAGDLGPSPVRLDSSIGSWLCDLTRAAAGTDLAFHNTGTLRAPIPKGEVRLRDVYRTMPFDNTVVTMRLSGEQVLRLLADNLRGGTSGIQVSGLEVEFSTAPDGAPAALRATRDGREVRRDEFFTVATNSYFAGGGTGGSAFDGGLDRKDTMQPVRDLLIKAFEAGPVKPPPAGRIRLR